MGKLVPPISPNNRGFVQSFHLSVYSECRFSIPYTLIIHTLSTKWSGWLRKYSIIHIKILTRWFEHRRRIKLDYFKLIIRYSIISSDKCWYFVQGWHNHEERNAQWAFHSIIITACLINYSLYPASLAATNLIHLVLAYCSSKCSGE